MVILEFSDLSISRNALIILRCQLYIELRLEALVDTVDGEGNYGRDHCHQASIG